MTPKFLPFAFMLSVAALGLLASPVASGQEEALAKPSFNPPAEAPCTPSHIATGAANLLLHAEDDLRVLGQYLQTLAQVEAGEHAAALEEALTLLLKAYPEPMGCVYRARQGARAVGAGKFGAFFELFGDLDAAGWEALADRNEPLLQFAPEEGLLGTTVPVWTKEGEVEGLLALIFQPDVFFELILRTVAPENAPGLIVASEAGQIIYRSSPFTHETRFLQEVATSQHGDFTSYRFDADSGELIPVEVQYATLEVYGTPMVFCLSRENSRNLLAADQLSGPWSGAYSDFVIPADTNLVEQLTASRGNLELSVEQQARDVILTLRLDDVEQVYEGLFAESRMSVWSRGSSPEERAYLEATFEPLKHALKGTIHFHRDGRMVKRSFYVLRSRD